MIERQEDKQIMLDSREQVSTTTPGPARHYATMEHCKAFDTYYRSFR
jgi:hypothetical protein